MSQLEAKALQARILELEAEVRAREQDVARFREELVKANRRLETLVSSLQVDLRVAHAIQRALVPTEFPHISGFEFSSKFLPSLVSGGDYFDIFEHEDKLRFGVVVSSASGHGMSALLLSVLLKMTGQLEARRGADPHLIVGQIAHDMQPNMDQQASADLFYALIDKRSYDLSFCRCGQVVALQQNFTNGDLKVLESTGESLSSRFKAPDQSAAINLNPRDRVIIATRGLIEAKNLEGEAFGLERLSRSILEAPKRGVHELRNRVLHDVQKFMHGQELARDITILVIEVKDKVIKLAKNPADQKSK